jgi:hypothetical protein
MSSERPDSRFCSLRQFFYVIGAQKGGTTWVQDYLESHPEVCVPVWKEVNYWFRVQHPKFVDRVVVRCRKAQDQQNWYRRLKKKIRPDPKARSLRLVERMMDGQKSGHRGYADVIFQEHRGETVAGEINPQYAWLSSQTYREMALLHPNTKFIFLMRDPVNRLYSGVRHSLKAPETRLDFTPDNLRERWTEFLANSDSWALRCSRYDQTIRELEAAVPAERIAYFFFEDLFVQSSIDRMTDFLGISRKPGDFGKMVNEGRGGELGMPEDLVERTREMLDPTYRYMAERFGSQLPSAWLA